MEPSVASALALARAQTRTARHLDAGLGAHHGISFSDYALLRELAAAEAGRMRPTDLAAHLHLTPSGVTRALLPLEKIGMLARERDQRDGRGSYARVTEAGKRVVDEATATVELACADIFRGLSVGQTRQLERLLSELR